MIQLVVGTFVSVAIGARDGTDLLRAVEAAIRAHAERIRRGEVLLPAPHWVDGPGTTLEVAFEPEVESLLAEEAARQQVSLGRLLSHLVILELAERDRQGLPLRLT